jgi:hypothetical protein
MFLVYHRACLTEWARRVTPAETAEYFNSRPHLYAMINEGLDQQLSARIIKCPLTNELYLFDKCFVDLIVSESYRQTNKLLKEGDTCSSCLFRVTQEMVCEHFFRGFIYYFYRFLQSMGRYFALAVHHCPAVVKSHAMHMMDWSM